MNTILSRRFTARDLRSLSFVAFLCASTVLGAAQPTDPFASVLPAYLQGTKSNPLTSDDVFDLFHSKETVAKSTAQVGMLFPASPPAVYPNEFRTIDGSRNAPGDLGRAGTIDLRNTTIGYADGLGTPGGTTRKGTREISNLVNFQTAPIPNKVNVSGFVWNWGNIVDHDMVLTKIAIPSDHLDIPIPQGDPVFDPKGRGGLFLTFNRSSALIVNGVRQQVNSNSAFLDGSVVYGSDKQRQNELRTLDGTGHLKTSAGNLMMFNVNGLPNQPPADRGLDPGLFFLGGDERSNENLALSTMQNLLVREHNFWANFIKAGNPTLDDTGIYQRARAIVVAEIQSITYRDFIPILLGPNALKPYTGYNSSVDPRVSLAFSTAGFRVGHTFLPPVISRLDTRNRSIGDLSLNLALFAPQFITKIGIEPYLRGLARQIPQEVDVSIVDGVRNFFTGIGTGFDLAALNIQRGRDHGLPSYNQVRIDYGLAPKASFAEVTSNPDFQSRLASAYSSPDDMDLWVGCLAEDHFNGGLVGETMFTIFKDQFERTRDGDRFWYESYLDPATLALVQPLTLGSMIKNNTSIAGEMQDEVFHVP
ncbi:MAG: peroxidase family protein [Chthoniobacterales bacterium]